MWVWVAYLRCGPLCLSVYDRIITVLYYQPSWLSTNAKFICKNIINYIRNVSFITCAWSTLRCIQCLLYILTWTEPLSKWIQSLSIAWWVLFSTVYWVKKIFVDGINMSVPIAYSWGREKERTWLRN